MLRITKIKKWHQGTCDSIDLHWFTNQLAFYAAWEMVIKILSCPESYRYS